MTSVAPEQSTESPLPDDRFSDRELSWLAFNQRVLELAEDPAVPLLERAKFLAIFANNLDEFYMVRVAGLKRRIAAGIAVRTVSGLTPREVMKQVGERTRQLMQRHAQSFRELNPLLHENGIELVRWRELDTDERKSMTTMFNEQIFAVLTPLAVDPAHPFPYISGLSLNLAVVVRNPATGAEHFARVKVPPTLPRFVPLNDFRFVPLEDVIAAHIDALFPGMEVLQNHAFRVTRNEDVEVEEDEVENLLKALERELTRRRFGSPVRLEVEETIDPHVLDLLVEELDIHRGEVVMLPGPLDLTGLFSLADLDLPEHQYPAFVPMTSVELMEVETSEAPAILDVMRQREVLLHHPYDSFSTSVQAFLEEASSDPNVLAIKQTLYRTSGDSPIVHALINAAEAGKQVLVLVEIKARFDEEANITWARKLEQAGCHVVYGVVGLKTHSKLSMVVRQDEDGTLRRYTHIGTGNYHPKTARTYEDLGSADQRLDHWRGRLQTFQRAHRILAEHRLPTIVGGPALGAERTCRTDRSRDRQPRRGTPQRHPLQGQLDRRRSHHRRALPGIGSGCDGGRLGPGHLRNPSRSSRFVGEHPRAEHPGSVLGALPHLLVCG